MLVTTREIIITLSELCSTTQIYGLYTIGTSASDCLVSLQFIAITRPIAFSRLKAQPRQIYLDSED